MPLDVSWTFQDSMGSQASATVTVSSGSQVLASRTVAGQLSASFGKGRAGRDRRPDAHRVAPGQVDDRPGVGRVGADGRRPAAAHPADAQDRRRRRRDGRARLGVARGLPTGRRKRRPSTCGAATSFSPPSRLGPRSSTPRRRSTSRVSYRALGAAESGSSCESSASVTVLSRGRAALNWGDGLGECAVACYNVEWDEERGRESEQFDAAAYELPVEVYGTHRTHEGKLIVHVDQARQEARHDFGMAGRRSLGGRLCAEAAVRRGGHMGQGRRLGGRAGRRHERRRRRLGGACP